MLLYWGMFTIGFLVGAILSYIALAPKKPEQDPEYETPFNNTQIINKNSINSEAVYQLEKQVMAKESAESASIGLIS